MERRILCMLLALATVFSLAAPALAEEEVVAAEEVVTTEEPVAEPEEAVEPESPEDAPAAAATGAAMGSCGDGVTYILTDDGKLTISGSGAIDNRAFRGRTDFVSVDIEDGVTGIGSYVFENCTRLISVTIPASVTSMGPGLFNGCTELTIVRVYAFSTGYTVAKRDGYPYELIDPETTISGKTGSLDWTIDAVGRMTISGSGALEFDASWRDAPYVAHYLTEAVIGDGVTAIGSGAFNACQELTSVTIPASVTSIGRQAFGSTALTSVTIPAGVKTIETQAFIQCKALKSVTIGKGVTTVGENAFCECTALTDVTIENGATVIGKNMFNGCTALKSVTIPASVTSIERFAFYNCDALASVTVLNPNCTIDSFSVRTLGVPGTTVISGYEGSTAQTFAKNCGYTFQSLGKAPGGITPTAAPKPTNTAKPTATPKPTNTPKPTATPVPTLAAPTVTIAQVADGIQVTWNKIAGSPRYMVYYKADYGVWTKIGTTTATSYTRKAANLKNGVKYTFTVRCCAEDKVTMLGPYKASNSITYTVDLAAPTVKIEQVSTGIKVSWNKVDGAPRYMVYYKEGNGGWKKIGTTTATSYTRAAKYLKNNVKYTFTVRCCANDKTTMLSSYKASNSLTYTAQLAAPTVKIAKVSTGIKVTWNKIAGAPRYMVYYKEGSGGWKKIGTTTATSYTRAAKYLKNGVTYTFTVRCCANDKKTLLGPYKASNSLTYKK